MTLDLGLVPATPHESSTGAARDLAGGKLQPRHKSWQEEGTMPRPHNSAQASNFLGGWS